MMPQLAELQLSGRFVKTFSSARPVQPAQPRTDSLRETADTLLRDLATVLHFTQVCRSLKTAPATTVAAA